MAHSSVLTVVSSSKKVGIGLYHYYHYHHRQHTSIIITINVTHYHSPVIIIIINFLWFISHKPKILGKVSIAHAQRNPLVHCSKYAWNSWIILWAFSNSLFSYQMALLGLELMKSKLSNLLPHLVISAWVAWQYLPL